MSSYRWVIVAVSFVITTIAYGIQYSFGVFFEPLQTTFGWTRAATSGAFSLYMFLHCAFAFIAGWATDKYGPRITVSLGGLVIASGLLLTSHVTTLWQLYLFYSVIVGLGLSTAYNPLVTTASRWFVDRRGLALGIVVAGVGTGTIIMSPLAAQLISLYGWSTCYVIIGLAGGVIIISAAQFLKKQPEVGAINKASQGEVQKIGKEQTLQQALHSRTFWILFIIYIFTCIGALMVMVHVVRYAEDRGISPLVAATVLSVIGGFSIVGRLAMGTISDKIGAKRSLFICLLLQGMAILGFIRATGVGIFYVVAVIFGFGYGGWVPQFPKLTGESFGLSHMGEIFGILLLAPGIGGAIGPILAGYIFDITGEYFVAWLLGAIATFIAAACVLRLPKASPSG